MRWDIFHRTEYRYGSPAKESFNEVRLQPMATAGQVIENFALKTVPAVRVKQYHDFYSNIVHHFEIPEPHESLVIESTVQALTTQPALREEKAIAYPLQQLSEAAHSFRCFEFLNASRYVDIEPQTWRLAVDAINGATDAWQATRAIITFVHNHLVYDSNSTSVHTHMQEVLTRRRGVCQDFAHVALGLFRAAKIPALYVSGYLATERASATHAWLEVFMPGLGWRGLDPTHNREVDESYLKIAVGRDYHDVAPVAGRYKGTLERKMDVEVRIKTRPA
jgi:transglutaminase-like putative cysteine protease